MAACQVRVSRGETGLPVAGALAERSQAHPPPPQVRRPPVQDSATIQSRAPMCPQPGSWPQVQVQDQDQGAKAHSRRVRVPPGQVPAGGVADQQARRYER